MLCVVGTHVALKPYQCDAAEDLPDAPVKNLILPGETFLLEESAAFVLWPPEELRREPQPWIMYAPTLPGYPDEHEKWMHEQFLAAGVAVAGIDAGEAYGSPRGQQWMSALYHELTERRGFAKKICLLGRSRGGLWVSSWAIAHPDKVAGIAGIYPVFDLRSYPGLDRAASAFELSAQELDAQLSRHNPIQKAEVLAQNRIPVYIIHGDDDKVVPLEANSAALANIYTRGKAADVFKLEVVAGQGHNFWEGFFKCKGLIEFGNESARDGCK
ncbi:MAG: prolyl oligopeptidase family serine peptidase [Planctomycetales bacterium]|nr:prolyl oligopeptidase family serine peptidase [Planctomycetales bacterium]